MKLFRSSIGTAVDADGASFCMSEMSLCLVCPGEGQLLSHLSSRGFRQPGGDAYIAQHQAEGKFHLRCQISFPGSAKGHKCFAYCT